MTASSVYQKFMDEPALTKVCCPYPIQAVVPHLLCACFVWNSLLCGHSSLHEQGTQPHRSAECYSQVIGNHGVLCITFCQKLYYTCTWQSSRCLCLCGCGPFGPKAGLYSISFMLRPMLQAFEKPEVKAAMADWFNNPRNRWKHRNNPEILMVSPAPLLVCNTCLHMYVSVYMCPPANLTGTLHTVRSLYAWRCFGLSCYIPLGF